MKSCIKNQKARLIAAILLCIIPIGMTACGSGTKSHDEPLPETRDTSVPIEMNTEVLKKKVADLSDDHKKALDQGDLEKAKKLEAEIKAKNFLIKKIARYRRAKIQADLADAQKAPAGDPPMEYLPAEDPPVKYLCVDDLSESGENLDNEEDLDDKFDNLPEAFRRQALEQKLREEAIDRENDEFLRHEEECSKAEGTPANTDKKMACNQKVKNTTPNQKQWIPTGPGRDNKSHAAPTTAHAPAPAAMTAQADHDQIEAHAPSTAATATQTEPLVRGVEQPILLVLQRRVEVLERRRIEILNRHLEEQERARQHMNQIENDEFLRHEQECANSPDSNAAVHGSQEPSPDSSSVSSDSSDSDSSTVSAADSVPTDWRYLQKRISLARREEAELERDQKHFKAPSHNSAQRINNPPGFMCGTVNSHNVHAIQNTGNRLNHLCVK